MPNRHFIRTLISFIVLFLAGLSILGIIHLLQAAEHHTKKLPITLDTSALPESAYTVRITRNVMRSDDCDLDFKHLKAKYPAGQPIKLADLCHGLTFDTAWVDLKDLTVSYARKGDDVTVVIHGKRLPWERGALFERDPPRKASTITVPGDHQP